MEAFILNLKEIGKIVFAIALGLAMLSTQITNSSSNAAAKTSETTVTKHVSKISHVKKSKDIRMKIKYNPKRDAIMSAKIFKNRGVVYWHSRKFTYYSPNGSHAYGMGAYTADGTYTLKGRDKQGYLILANNKRFGTKIKTPLGWGVVHDRGTFGNHYDIVIE